MELRGHPLVVNFWASWCLPCKEETPRLVEVARGQAGKIAFLGVDVQDFTSDARRFLARYRVNYVAVHDGAEATFTAYGLIGLPETFFIDQHGRIVAHVVGKLSAAELAQGVSRITARS
jgi:cytochrome c biogenesis protein CcmG/thiol:disulfide interchange protein DsbE